MRFSFRAVSACVVVTLSLPAAAAAQVEHKHSEPATAPSSWHLMQDGALWLTYNRQGGPRGGEEFGSQNWWMGMASRPAGGGMLQLNLMLSLDPLTLGENGYREIFQAGETLDGRPMIDRQHPHDFLMQASVAWRKPLAKGYALTLAGAPVGEPALGPVAFMHRASASENPTAPLSHHTLDSTHIAMGVLTAGLDRGPFQLEGSVFQGREPDEQRWDLVDPGPLDSWSVRGWYRPNPAWTLQLSHGFLTTPEPLEEGNVRRTTASVSWLGSGRFGATAATIAYGRNDKRRADYNALLAEATQTFGANVVYGRYEALEVETDVLRFGTHGGEGHHGHEDGAQTGGDVVHALTVGGVRTIGRWSGWDVGAGADVTFHRVPTILQPTHGERPRSFHLFIRVRPPAPMGRMGEMVMGRFH